MPRPAMPPKLYRIKSPFTIWENGVPVPYNDRTVVFSEEHPMVKKNLGNFEEITVAGPMRRAVEETTANPGESR